MVEDDFDYVELLHWRLAGVPKRVAVEFMYSRFAHTIINQIPSSSTMHFKAVEVNPAVLLANQIRLTKENAAAKEILEKSVESSSTLGSGDSGECTKD